MEASTVLHHHHHHHIGIIDELLATAGNFEDVSSLGEGSMLVACEDDYLDEEETTLVPDCDHPLIISAMSEAADNIMPHQVVAKSIVYESQSAHYTWIIHWTV